MAAAAKSIGLLTSFTPEIFKSEYFTRIISGIIGPLRHTDYTLKLIMVRDEEYADPSLKLLEDHDVDGLLLLTWRIHPKYIEETMQGSSLPVVVINDFVPEMKANIVYNDAAKGMEIAFEHLLSRNHKRIGYLHGPDEASLDARIRYEKYRELLKQQDMPFEATFYRKCDYFFEEDGYLKMMDIIQNCKLLPSAMICMNDDIAMGALKALKESWIQCPDEVAIIGFDGIERGRHVNPPLTTVSQPLETMGREMVTILIDLIEGRITGPVQKNFSPQLIIRQST